MTETVESPVRQALELVDGGLADLQSRELVSASTVADMLLDLRLVLLELEADALDDRPEAALAP